MLGARRLMGLGIAPKAQGSTIWDVAAATWHSCAPLLSAAGAGDPSPEEQRPDKTYVDRLKVTVRAGKGGAGCVSFWRSAAKGKYTPADGGDGGDGGSVIVRASSHMKSLAGVPQLLKAEGGKHGSRQKLQGRRGKDAVLLVPTGTVVSKLIEEEEEEGVEGSGEQPPEWLQQWKRPWVGAEDYTSDNEEEGDQNERKQSNAGTSSSGSVTSSAAEGRKEAERYVMLADLTEDGQEVVAARGGQGGRGNAAARSLPRRPAPSAPAAPPTSGENARLLLELKLMADVALVGLPNAGKSSLLRALSAAQPRVGAYPFTTLRPQLGALFMGPGRRRVVVADVPGIIEGAHANRGLGHRFLRHAERARALALVVDAAGGGTAGVGSKRRRNEDEDINNAEEEEIEESGGRRKGRNEAAAFTPWAQAELLRSEIGAYSSELLARPWLLIANKVDLLKRPGATLAALRRRAAKAGAVGVVGVSALEGTGVAELSAAIEALAGDEE